MRATPSERESWHSWKWRGGFFALIYLAALPLVLLLVVHRLWVRRKALTGLGEKFGGGGGPLTPGQILVHGVSLGEVMLMRPLVPKLETAFAGNCLLTTTTETGRAALDQHFPQHQRAFLPLDLPWAVAGFLARARPRLVILLELEVWPVLLCACFARGIPVALVNARVSEKSFRGYARGGALLRPLFRGLALALAQNGLWAARLARLGVRRDRVVASGSMKADMVRRADDAAVAHEAARLGLVAGRPVLLLASTSSGGAGKVEEQIVLDQQLGRWRQLGWQIVLCPRHPERGAELGELIRRLSTTAAPAVARRSSQGERLDGADQILIVDEIGKLAALYAWTAQVGGIAVVGGSLGSGRGGQNMLEAAAAGCCTVVGPDTRNFPDAMALLRAEVGVVEVAADRLTGILSALAEDPARRRALGAAGQRAWAMGQGATDRAVELLRRALADDAGKNR